MPALQVALEDSVLSWLGPASKDADDDTQPDLQANDAKSTPVPAKTPASAAPAPKPQGASPVQAPAKPKPPKRRRTGPVAPTGKPKLPPQPSGAGPKRLIPLRRPTR